MTLIHNGIISYVPLFLYPHRPLVDLGETATRSHIGNVQRWSQLAHEMKRVVGAMSGKAKRGWFPEGKGRNEMRNCGVIW